MHNGIEYEEGDSFKDQCNRCRCARGGMSACTRMMCLSDMASCEHNGNSYFKGEAFMDDCNVCRCGKKGRVACTKRRC